MAKQPFVRTANFTDISKKLKPIAGQIAQNQTLGNIPQLASAMSSNEQIIKNNPITNFQFDKKMPVGGFLAEDKRELNSDETEFAMENFARLPKNIQEQLIASGQAPQQYMGKEAIGDFLKTYNLPDSKYGTPSDRDLMNQTFGVSGTDLSKEDAGALPKDAPKATTKTTALSAVDYAKQIAEGLYDGQTGGEPDWGVASLLYFSKLAENASKPGATFLGAAGSAGSAPAAYLMQKEKEKADLELKKKATVASLIPSIITAQKGKVGKMNVIMAGPVMGDDGKQKTNEKGDLLFKHIRQDAGGNTLETFEAPAKSGATTTIIDKTKGEADKSRLKLMFKDWEEQRTASSDATKNLPNIEQLLTFLTDPNFKTGMGEELLLKMRQFGSMLGFEVDSQAMSSAESFKAGAYKLVLGSVSQMKGALSDKELAFLEAQNPSLSMTTNTNKILLYTMKHAMDKAASFNKHTRAWERENGAIDSVEKYNEMIDSFKAQPINQLNPKDYIQGLAEQEEVNLILAEGGQVDDNGDLVAGSLTPAQISKIGTKLEQKYSLSLLDRTFKNYFTSGDSAYKLDKRNIPSKKSGGTK
jgi:hypothetical protein